MIAAPPTRSAGFASPFAGPGLGPGAGPGAGPGTGASANPGHHPGPSRPIRAAFVCEQTLGHVTHYANLRAAAERPADEGMGAKRITPTWLPLPFAPRGPLAFLPVVRSNWSVRASWLARRALARTLRTTPLDVLFFHTQVTSLFSVDLMRRLPAIVSLDATPINYDAVAAGYGHRPASGGWLDRRKLALNRAALRAAARVVTWSDWAARSVVHDYGVPAERVRVIPPGAAPLFFEIGAQRHVQPPGTAAPPTGAASEGAAARPVRLLFVGGDFARKGGPLLLECVRDGLGGRCEVDLVTQDPVPPELAGPHARVHHGVTANSPALRGLFECADVFVLPTTADCLPVALMEAAAAGLPLVTTNIAALPEIARDRETGLLVPPGDGRALCTALETLVGDAALRRRLGRAAHALACERFDSRRNNSALFDLVVEVDGRSIA